MKWKALAQAIGELLLILLCCSVGISILTLIALQFANPFAIIPIMFVAIISFAILENLYKGFKITGE